MLRFPRRLVLLWLWTLGFAFAAPDAGLVISELMYHPASTNVLEEYVEIFNPGIALVNLAGWQFTQGIRFVFPTNATLAPGGYLVVAADEATFRAQHPGMSNVVAGWTGTLSDHGESVVLADAAGTTVAEVAYAPEGDWAVRRIGAPDQYGQTGWEWLAEHDGGGKSLELISASLPNHHPHNWATSAAQGGSPGRPNSVANSPLAPLVSDVTHFPIVPQSGDTVTINARVMAELATGVTVTLFHRVDGSPDFTAAPMFDDGGHGDGLPGDGLFGARLPAHPDGTVIEFYLTARDARGLVRTYPAVQPSGTARTANLLYEVANEGNSGAQPTYRIIMNRAEFDALKKVWSSEPNSDATSSGTFISTDGVVENGVTTQWRYSAGFRNRGHGTRVSVPHNFRVDIPQDRPWQKREGINLNTQFTQAQLIGSALMRRAGVPMAESRAARVRINGDDLANAGSPQFGAYAANELVNSALVQRQFPGDPDGNFYRGIRDVYPGNPKADLAWHGPAFTAYTNAYFKQNNTDRNDWSDLVRLLDVLNNSVDAEYAAAVRTVADVPQWMRYFALNTLMGNRETALATGYGDDFAMYRGVHDPRFLLLPYDLDSVLGAGTRTITYADGLFRMLGEGNHEIPTLARLMKHPEFAPIYYRELMDLADTIFEPAILEPVLDQYQQAFTPGAQIEAAIANMKAFNRSQLAYVRSQIPLTLTVTNLLPIQSGFHRSTTATTALSGVSPAIATRRVLVSGQAATWSAWEAKWTAASVTLHPGINRILVQALNDAGIEFQRATLDVWYDDGSVATVSGTVAANTTWTPESGPYNVTASVTVASGATLTIQPGTTVYLGPGVNFTVANGGRLLAQGTVSAPIRFTRAPGATANWGGIVINGAGASPETVMAYAHLEFNGTTGIEVAGGTVLLDHLTFGSTDHQYVALDGASFVVSRCIFPGGTAAFELMHGTGGIKAGGHGIVRECFFGSPIGYNDVVDFTGGNRATQPIIQFINNVFTGATDDVLDLDNTDAWIEGNLFLHVHKNGSPDSASGVSGGNDNGMPSEITIIGNLFYDCDQAVTGKERNFFTLLNNTIVHQTKVGGLDTEAAVVNLGDDGKAEGAGMYLEGNIIYDAEKLLRNMVTAMVTLTNNLSSLPWTGLGGGNRGVDPLLRHVPTLAETQFKTWEEAQVLREWFSLQSGSPARGAGPNGRDLGGAIPLGASISGEPAGTNANRSATLVVGSNRTGQGITTAGWPDGSGYTHYRWRLDGGAWSAEMPIALPIVLTGLANGPHSVAVTGRRDSGSYQDDPLFGEDALVTASRTWVVDPTYVAPAPVGLRLNEVLANNVATFTSGETTPDLVELFNEGADPVDLSGVGVSDDAANPYQFKFPPGTTLAPGAYLVLLADNDTNSPGIHLGFALRQTGESVFLRGSVARGGTLLDSVTFGVQIADYSIGRRADGSWGLCQPTLGAANIAQRTGEARFLKINEWLANARFVSANDFVELFNPEPVLVDLSGLLLSDAPGTLGRHAVAQLSFIGAGACLAFLADGNSSAGANHLDFKLAAETGSLHLSAADLAPIDVINYGPQRTDVSQGRTPSGAATFAYFKQPTPGALNPGIGSGASTVTYVSRHLIDFGATWKYSATGVDLGTSWRSVGFDDGSWKSGPALFGLEPSSPYPYPLPIRTALPLVAGANRIKTFYFRTHFDAGATTAGFTLYTTNFLDDGAVFYLNGQRVGAIRVTDNPATYASDAVNQPNEGQVEILSFPADHLVPGDNVLAVEVHQSGSSSTDVVFGLALGAVEAVTNTVSATGTPLVLNEILSRNRPSTNATPAGWVELFNPTTNAVSGTDLSLSDDSATPRKWVCPAGVTVPPRGFYRIFCDATRPSSATNAPFDLSVTGGAVFLFDRLGDGGRSLDALNFGLQVPGLALGRVPDGADDWVLTVASPGALNTPSVLGSPAALRLNEWMADPVSGSDWFELYNGDAAPVSLSGLSFTDDLGNRTKSPLPPLSFIGTGGDAYLQFLADKKPTAGANHVDFKLGKGGSPLGLFALSGVQLDALSFGPQATGVSEGRLPDGALTFAVFPGSPTPAAPNRVLTGSLDTDGDGLPDAWEEVHGLNKLVNDSGLDADGDGLTNLSEYLAGTDPRDASSGLALTAVTTGEGVLTLSFPGVSGHSYTVQFEDQLGAAGWQGLVNLPVQTLSGSVTLTVSSLGTSARFFRVVTPAVP